MSLKCVRCGKIISNSICPGQDKAGVCIKCSREPLTYFQKKDLERHGEKR